MTDIGKKAKVQITWKVSPYEYTQDAVLDIIGKFSKKYGIPKDSIRVTPIFTILDGVDTIECASGIIENIQNPEFQQGLFKEYISNNNIEGINFNDIQSIDNDINYMVGVDNNTKMHRYEIKWIKWSNFLSYGKDNYFDFRNLNGLVLLNGDPSNQSGKTTFAIDLIRFLLFGNTKKATKQEKIFNIWLKEETTVSVEGCICINGCDYIIKRTLTRPQYKKRTSKSKTTQKVEYYKIVGGTEEELEDYVDELQEENTAKTNKVIKDAIGNESDFELTICATSENIDDLIEKKDTERGRILSRWIGLVPIERKEEIAKEKFNKDINPSLLINKFNEEELKSRIQECNEKIGVYSAEIEKLTSEKNSLDTLIKKTCETRDALVAARKDISDAAENIDITSLERSIETITQRGTSLREKIAEIGKQIEEINIGTFSEDEYERLVNEKLEKSSSLSVSRNDYKHLLQNKEDLKRGEYCPTCGRKLDNIDNSARIAEIEERIGNTMAIGTQLSKEVAELDKKIDSMKQSRENFNLKSKLKIDKSAYEVQIEQLRNELRDKLQLRKEYISNKEAIETNMQLQLKIRNIEIELINYRNTKEKNTICISQMETDIKNLKSTIDEINSIIGKMKEERQIVKNWKLYLDMIGKNGITKMVLRRALPIINAQLVHLLSDVCDFDVEISITDKNEVNFNILKENTVSDISCASGFEKTAAALALRFVLAKNSVLPKPNYIVLDEVLSRVANDNLDNISLILDRIKDEYSFILIVTHNEYFKEKANSIITVTKKDNISMLKIQ